VPITLELRDTKIVIPDQVNNQIIHINNIKGEGKVERGGFSPTDVDVDRQGRVYVADVFNGLFRYETLGFIEPEAIAGGVSSGSLAVDRDRNRRLLYHNEGGYLWRVDDFGDGFQDQIDELGTIDGMDVGANGILYRARNAAIQIYDPATGSVLYELVGAAVDDVADVMVRGNLLYALLLDSDGGDSVARYRIVPGPALVLDGELDGPPSGGWWYGPKRFLARTRTSIYFLDVGVFLDQNRVVRISDIDGSGYAEWNIPAIPR
jgi:hypothetical protein